MMDINDFLGIGVVGILTSCLVEFITQKMGTTSNGSKAVSAIVSLLIGTGYFYIRSTAWFPTFLGILTVSSTVYAFIFNKPVSVGTI